MGRSWTFGQKIGLGFTSMVVFIIIICTVSIFTLRSLINEKDKVISVNAQLLIHSERLLAIDETKTASFRGFLLTKDEQLLEKLDTARLDFNNAVEQMESLVPSSQEKEL